MSYILNKTDGTPLVTIPNKSTTGTDYSVTFIGKNTLSYGEALNESLLHLMENSASDSGARPVNPVIGQTWYNKTDKTLYVCYQERVGTTPARFRALAKSNTGSGTPEDPLPGDIWYDPPAVGSLSATNSGSLKLYVGPPKGWITVGPQVQSDWGQADINQVDYIKNKPLGFAPELRVLYGNNVVTDKITKNINFTGSGVTVNLVNGTTDSVVVEIAGSGSASASTITVGDIAPPNPVAGTLWYENTTLGRGFVYDGVEWVDFSPAIGGGGTAVAASTPNAASTSFVLATKDGTAKSMGVVLSPGTWQLILDTRVGITSTAAGSYTATQIANVQYGGTTNASVATEVRAYVGSSATAVTGLAKFGSTPPTAGAATVAAFNDNKNILNSTSDIAVTEFVISVDTAVIISMQEVIVNVAVFQPIGSILTLSKISATDAQKIYSGTMPTFTVPPAQGVGGAGSKWYDVLSARAALGNDAKHTNNRSYPIAVAVSNGPGNGSPSITIYVDGVRVSYFQYQFNGNGAHGGGYAIVPPGSYYQVHWEVAAPSMWVELY